MTRLQSAESPTSNNVARSEVDEERVWQPLICIGNMLNQSSPPEREKHLQRAIKNGIAE